MSIIRLSCIRDTLYAPAPNGEFAPELYRKRRRQGKMESLTSPELASPSSGLGHYMASQINQAALNLPVNQPVVVMVHGFLFDPRHAVTPDPRDSDNAHSRVYHFTNGDELEEQRHHTTGWPRHLGFDAADETGRSGLAVAFGWHSQPGFASSLIARFQNFYSRAYDYAEQTAWPLANVLYQLARHPRLADHPIDLFVHSLGARVVIRCLALMAKRAGEADGTHQTELRHLLERLGRVIILGGSEYVFEANLMYRRVQRLGLDESKGPVFYNIASRENDVLDILAENFGPVFFGNSQVIGHNGLETQEKALRWMDLQIDSKELQEWLQKNHGVEVSGDRPGNVWDHWYYYTHRGNMDFYRRIIRQPDHGQWDHATLRTRKPPIPEGVLVAAAQFRQRSHRRTPAGSRFRDSPVSRTDR